MGQADIILDKLRAGPAVKKLVETSIALSHSADAQQRNHAFSFMESALRELEDDKGERRGDDKEDEKRAVDKALHEEELSNHNTGSRDEGSEQSSDNTEPYPGTGKDTTDGEKPMQDLSGTENQFNETGGMMVPGLAPDVAQEMGNHMPQMPPMNTPQMMKQMQYTINQALKKYHETVMRPFARTMNNKISETRKLNSVTELDLDHLKNNANAKFRETIPELKQIPSIQPRTTLKREKISDARSEIEQMNNILNSQNSSIYN